MYNPDMYYRYKSPEAAVATKRVGMRKPVFFTLAFQTFMVFGLWMMNESRSWLSIKRASFADSGGLPEGCTQFTRQKIVTDVDLHNSDFDKFVIGKSYNCFFGVGDQQNMSIDLAHPEINVKFSPYIIFDKSKTSTSIPEKYRLADDEGGEEKSLPAMTALLKPFFRRLPRIFRRCYQVSTRWRQFFGNWALGTAVAAMAILIGSLVSCTIYDDTHALTKILVILGAALQLLNHLFQIIEVILVVRIQIICGHDTVWENATYLAVTISVISFVPSFLISFLVRAASVTYAEI